MAQQAASLTERNNRHTRLLIEIPILGYFGVWGYFWVRLFIYFLCKI